MENFVEFITGFWAVLTQMSPYLLLGFAAAGILSVLISPRLIERHLGGEGFAASLKAAMFGVPLPLCSCGVIPVSASLRRHGAGQGPTISFLASTPQTGVDSMLVTYSLLGWVYAVVRPIIALLSGLISGLLVSGITRHGSRGRNPEQCCGDAGLGHADTHVHTQACVAEPIEGGRCEDDSCCEDHAAAPMQSRLWRATHYGFVELPQDIGKALLIGVLISAVITAFVPENFIARVGGGGIVSMLVMGLLGIPMYVCATASVPVAAALIAKGVTPGAALVFLMTGPATNVATLTTIWRVMGPRSATTYLLSIFGTAIAAGFALNALLGLEAVPNVVAHVHTEPSLLGHIGAVILLGVLGFSTLRPIWRKYRMSEHAHRHEEMQTLRLNVDGMTCNHCVRVVRESLQSQPGVHSAEVDLQASQALVQGTDMDTRTLTDAVESLGYSAEVIEDRPAEPVDTGEPT